MKAGKSMAGAAGGAGDLRKVESGCATYPACTRSTFGMSAGPKSCVRKIAMPSCVSRGKTLATPSGFVPFQPGPAIR